MTIIAFNGDELAADSRRTVKTVNKKTRESRPSRRTDGHAKITLYKVPNPNSNLSSTTSAAEIVNADPFPRFREQYVAAVARAGNRHLTGPLLEKLAKGQDIEMYYDQLLRHEPAVKDRSCSLIIITLTQSWYVQVTKSGKWNVSEIPPGTPFAIGDGKDQAMWLMKHFGFTPAEAVMAVASNSDKCGWPVFSYKRCGHEGGRWKINAVVGGTRSEDGTAQKEMTDEEAKMWVAKATIYRMRLLQAKIERATPYEEDANVQLHGAVDLLMGALRDVMP